MENVGKNHGKPINGLQTTEKCREKPWKNRFGMVWAGLGYIGIPYFDHFPLGCNGELTTGQQYKTSNQ
jgi:hypothetical protein